MSATSGNKRSREGMVKQEDKAPDQQPQLVEPQQLEAFDLKKTRERGSGICSTIRDFEWSFSLSSDWRPIVLHFTITEWAAAFHAELLKFGLDEKSVKVQISATLTLCLAKFAVDVAKTDTAQLLDVTNRWLIEPYVTEAVGLGYFEDKQKTIEIILRAMQNLAAPA